MKTRADRLKKLVILQEKLTALHETRHAGFVVAQANARRDADDLVAHFNMEGSLASAFPELYNRRIAVARSLERASGLMAESEAKAVATATVRTNMVEREWQDARSREERQRAEADSLEFLGRNTLTPSRVDKV